MADADDRVAESTRDIWAAEPSSFAVTGATKEAATNVFVLKYRFALAELND